MFSECLCVGPYPGRLQKGKFYYVGSAHLCRLMVDVCDDRGEIASYPAEFFDILEELLAYSSYSGQDESA